MRADAPSCAFSRHDAEIVFDGGTRMSEGKNPHAVALGRLCGRVEARWEVSWEASGGPKRSPTKP